jgi:hypothetical protein
LGARLGPRVVPCPTWSCLEVPVVVAWGREHEAPSQPRPLRPPVQHVSVWAQGLASPGCGVVRTPLYVCWGRPVAVAAAARPCLVGRGLLCPPWQCPGGSLAARMAQAHHRPEG